MDQTTLVNCAIVIALMLLAVSAVLLACSLPAVLHQAQQTLAAFERLAKTLDREIPPTLVEVRSVIEGVNQVKALTMQRFNDVGSQVEEVTGNVSTVVNSAQKQSKVLSTGLLAGLKSYFSNKDQGTGNQ